MDCPKTLMDVVRMFSTEEDCRDYLFRLRWPAGFRCPRCGGDGQAGPDPCRQFRCGQCRGKVSATTGTIFEGSHKPLALWFRAIWWISGQENGASALGLQRVLGLGSYQTAWTWLQKLRRAMVNSELDRLAGTIHVDEAYFNAATSQASGEGGLVLVFVQERGHETGRIRFKRIPDTAAETLEAAIRGSVVPGSRVKTDGWEGYKGLGALGYEHRVIRSSADIGVNLLPWCDLETNQAKRWLAGTHRGAVGQRHLAYYLNEYTFRFNRRKLEHRGLIFRLLLQNIVAVEGATHAGIAPGESP